MKETNIGESPLIGIPGKKLAFRIKDGSITLKKLSAEVLNLIMMGGSGSEGVGINLVDISERMTQPNDTITDMEIKMSQFVYGVYNRVSSIARVVEPQSKIKYALFKVFLNNEKAGNINVVYVAYTTEDSFSDGATWHYKEIINEYSPLYLWAMSVFGDVTIDYSSDTLVIGNSIYHLEQPVPNTIYIGQTSGSVSSFALLDTDDLVDAAIAADAASGSAASGTVAGVSVAGCYLHTLHVDAGNSIFYALLPLHLSIAASTMIVGEQTTGTWNGNEIKDHFNWEAAHSNIIIGGNEYAVYGYRNIALGGSTMNIYVR